MDRLSFPAAALAAMALLVWIPADARGQSEAVAPASESPATEPATPDPAPAASDAGTGSDTTSSPAAEPAPAETTAPSAVVQETTPPATTDPAPTATPVTPASTDTGASSPVSSDTGSSGSTETQALAEEGDAYVLAQPVNNSSAPTADLKPVGPDAGPVNRGGPEAVTGTPAVLPTPAPAGVRNGTGLKAALPEMERDLREVQAQINDLRRRLDQGTPAPAVSLINLRLSLESLAPALVALDGRLDAAELSPAMERQVRRLRARLAGTQASAVGLLVDLERSGAYGLELGLLVHELQSFAALDLGPIASPAGPAPRPHPSAVHAPHVAVPPAPVAARTLPPTPASVEAASQRRPPAAPDAVSPDDDPAPWSLPAGSASPGSALSAAGVAALAALLIGLALSRLRVALAVAPNRRYSVMFLSPLERPG